MVDKQNTSTPHKESVREQQAQVALQGKLQDKRDEEAFRGSGSPSDGQAVLPHPRKKSR